MTREKLFRAPKSKHIEEKNVSIIWMILFLFFLSIQSKIEKMALVSHVFLIIMAF